MTEKITELGYIGIGVKDIEAWKKFAAEIIGLEVVDGDHPGQCFLRMDYWHHRIIVEEDGTDDLSVLGFRVGGAQKFRNMQKQLEAAGVEVQMGTKEEARARHVLELMKLQDPSGNPLEIFHGPHVQTHKPFHPGRGLHGRFMTGDGGVGHLILRETVGFEKTHAFYSLLGMRGGIEYQITIPGMDDPFEIMFLHCNSRDHTLAFGIPGQTRINHLMLEVDNLDDVYLTYEQVRKSQYPVVMAPGKHSNDRMFSFYCATPAGFQIEIGWGGREATHQSEYYQGDMYGHEFVPREL